jgi:Rab GTPase-binding effector protein 1
VVRELKRLQGENDILVGKHNAKSAEMQAEAINLPEGAEEMQLMLLKLREELIAAKVAEERATERMAQEVRGV